MRATIVAIAVLTASTASAADNSWDVAGPLGKMLAAEKMCGLSFKPEGIKAFISEHVAPKDLDFAGLLRMSVGASLNEQPEMPPSEKVALCATVEQTAREYGFID